MRPLPRFGQLTCLVPRQGSLSYHISLSCVGLTRLRFVLVVLSSSQAGSWKRAVKIFHGVALRGVFRPNSNVTRATHARADKPPVAPMIRRLRSTDCDPSTAIHRLRSIAPRGVCQRHLASIGRSPGKVVVGTTLPRTTNPGAHPANRQRCHLLSRYDVVAVTWPSSWTTPVSGITT